MCYTVKNYFLTNWHDLKRINQVSAEMTRKLLSRFLRVVSVLLVIFAVAGLMLSMLLKDVNYYTRMGLENFEKATGYRLTFRDVTTHVGRGFGLRIDDFTLSQPATGREFLRGSHIYVRIKLSHLLQKRITIQQLFFESPQIQVYRDADGTWHSFLSALLAPDEEHTASIFGGYNVTAENISLSGGSLEVRDEKNDRAVRLHDCDITLHREDEGILRMQLTAQHNAEGSRGIVRYTSEFHRSLLKRGGPNKKVPILLSAVLAFDNLPVRECLSYLPENIAVPLGGGLLDGSLAFELKQEQRISAQGELTLKESQSAFPGLAPVLLPETRVTFKADKDTGSIHYPEFSIRIGTDLHVSGSAEIENFDAEYPTIAVRMDSGTLHIREIAARVATADPQRFAWLLQSCERVSAGAVTIHELDLSAPLGSAFKPDMISLKARLGVEGFGYTTPQLRLPPLSVKTLSLELENGNLRVQGRAHLVPEDDHAFDLTMTTPGKKTRLDCTITSRLTPASVSALLDGLADEHARSTAAMQEGGITLKTVIHCDERLRISSDIDATDAAYSFAGIIGKPRAVPNTLKLEYVHGKTPAQVPFVFRLGDSFNTKGCLLYADAVAVEGTFAAKDFDLSTLAFPFLSPALSLSGLLSGNGEFSFPAKKGLRPVAGTLKLDDIALLKQSDAQTLIQVDSALDFSSPGPILVSAGHVIAGDTRGAFSGTLNSVMPLVGTFAAPMEVYDIGDFVDIMLDIVRSVAKPDHAPAAQPDDSGGTFAQMDLAVDLTSRQTTYLGWHFGPGRSDFSIKDKRLLWDAVDIECGNGTLNGSVLYDLSNPAHYRLEFVIDRTDVDVIWAIPGFQEKQTITGRLDLKSRFSSNFKTSKELLKNMEGTFDFVVNNGKIKKMTLLSNILNALNVVQLLTFTMPEFSAHGMPFDTMTGRFLLKDLKLTTDDLLVQCPSMDFSVAGIFGFDVGELDLLIGVQIFRTVAKALGAIPYLGRKITGEGKTLTFAYFRARGSFDNPGIMPVPLKAIDNAILKIFKSVWEVPQDLIGLPLGMIRLFSEQDTDNATTQ